MRNRLFALIVASFSLLGCVPHPIDSYYPNPLHGLVDNKTYTMNIGARPGLGKFRVDMPHEFNEYEHPYIVKREIVRDDYTFTSFGPAAADDTIYRIMVAYKNGASLWAFRDQCFPYIQNIVAKGYDRHMVKIYETNVIIDGRPAIYEVWVQRQFGVYNYIGMFQPGKIMLTHALLTIDYGRYGVFLWMQTSSDSGFNTVNKVNRIQIVRRTFIPLRQFVRSFVLFPGSYGLRRI